MSDSLGTLQFKDSDKADRAVIVLLCIYGVSDHGVYGDIYNHNFKENIQFYGIGDMVLKIDQDMQLAEYSCRRQQNASLQGSVRGKLTKGITVHFRSALELMRMINMVKKQR